MALVQVTCSDGETKYINQDQVVMTSADKKHVLLSTGSWIDLQEPLT